MADTRTQALPLPGIIHGQYPERRATEPGWLDPLRRHISAWREWLKLDALGPYRRFASRVDGLAVTYRPLDNRAFAAAICDVRANLGRHGLVDEHLAHAFAVAREAIRRETGMTPFATQVIAARVMLDRRLAEMHTGEGKTLAIALAAGSAALAGIPVHVLTANEYLVARDAESLSRIYARLGLTVGAVTADLGAEARRAAYARDITYATAKELVFDYLRDRQLPHMARSALQRRVLGLTAPGHAGVQPVLRGLCLAIVDEADNVLLDEAITPLVLSRPGGGLLETRHLHQALGLARGLEQPLHYTLDPHGHTVQLTEAGRQIVDETSAGWGGLWRSPRFREGLTILALSALHAYHRDRDYLLVAGKVQMVDATTGRLAEGRQWSRGLHQLLEIKEGCETSPTLQTLAQITYQRFFPRYLQLGGTSATLREATRELWHVYGLAVTRVPLKRPSRRIDLPPRLYYRTAHKWQAVVDRVREVAAEGRAVLIGTDSVADSEALSRLMERAGISHIVLNARQDRDEAEIVALAGQPGAVTVATNMAGRGTDIPLADAVRARGGLHVISCQHNSSARIDRQLHGRCARQGDPGSTETILSLEDPLLRRYLPAVLRAGLPTLWPDAQRLPAWLVRLLIAWPQRREEARQRRLRARLLQRDRQVRKWLAIGGAGE